MVHMNLETVAAKCYKETNSVAQAKQNITLVLNNNL